VSTKLRHKFSSVLKDVFLEAETGSKVAYGNVSTYADLDDLRLDQPFALHFRAFCIRGDRVSFEGKTGDCTWTIGGQIVYLYWSPGPSDPNEVSDGLKSGRWESDTSWT
jgi:hypothetical protein